MPRFIAYGLLLALITLAPATALAASATPETPMRVLVFSKTAGFRHDSIPAGIEAIQELGRRHDFAVTAGEDADLFSDAGLRGFSVVVFLNTTGDILDSTQEAAFERYIRAGGGYVGVHAANDTEYDWPWYGRLVGAYFKSHPAVQDASVMVVDREHPATRMLPERWNRRDEWYNFRANPKNVRVLAKLDETTYQGGSHDNDHPIIWCHEFEGGRALYTGLGHTKECFADELVRQHLLGALRWAGRRL